MADKVFKIFQVTDTKAMEQLQNICKELQIEDAATLNIVLLNGIPSISGVKWAELESKPGLKQILNANTNIIQRISVNIASNTVSNIVFDRSNEHFDQITISFNNCKPDIAVPYLITVQKHFQIYDPTQNLDKTLGPELAEFYRKREQGLIRLEELTEKLINQNEAYRRNLDQEHLDHKSKLDKEHELLKAELKQERDELLIEVQEQRQELEKKVKKLDDRDSKHSRRQLRNDIKEELKNRSKSFNLTQSTNLKRLPIHMLFMTLISLLLVCGVVTSRMIGIDESSGNKQDDIYISIRLAMIIISFVVTVIFYIRWNDQWAQTHANEEFRLKRLDLDIDRASWVVEMAMEWKEDKGTELPRELLERLSQNLFVDNIKSDLTKHPYEDVIKTLLNVSAEAKIPLPGGGKLKIDKKGMKTLAK